MSDIQKEICKVLDLDAPKKASERQAFLSKVVKELNNVNDADWAKLSKDAQQWFNSAADAKNAKAATLPDFPDLDEEAEEETTTRRRATSDDDAPKATGTKEIDPEDVKEKMAVRIITKRGKDISGVVVEVTKKIVAIKLGNGDEEEYDFDRIDKILVAAEAEKEEGTKRRRSAEDDEPADPIKVGAMVKIVTKRGKEAEGEILELTDDMLLLKEGKDEVEYSRDRIESIKPLGGKAAQEEGGTRRRATSDDKADKGDGEKRTRASNEGISVADAVTHAILDDMEADMETIGKAIKKKGVEFRENTLTLNYKATHKFLAILKERKMLKA